MCGVGRLLARPRIGAQFRLFLGFIMVIYLKMDVVGVAAAAICVALLLAFREGSSGPQTVAADEEEDF